MNKYAKLYNELVRRYNKTRKSIIRKQRKQDEEDNSMRSRGIMPPRRMAKVIPQRMSYVEGVDAETMNKAGYEAFKKRIQEIGASSELEFYKTAYKDNYLEVLRESMIGENPETRKVFGKYETNKTPYSQEQINNCEDFETKQLMKLYNQIYYMSTEKFMALYENGYIVKLAYIYHGILDTKEQDFYDEQQAFIEQAKLEGRFERWGRRRTRRERKRGKKINSTKRPQKFNKNRAKSSYRKLKGHDYKKE